MSNFIKQQEAVKDAKEVEKLSRETLGKFFYDLAKIVFTGIVVGDIITYVSDTSKQFLWVFVAVGLFATIILAYVGYQIIKKK